MPRKKSVRRFDPPMGVSREMVAHEARYIAKELDDYLILAPSDVQRFLSERRSAWKQADRVLGQQIARLPERECIALQAMLVRDSYHLLELYLAHVQERISSGDVAPPPIKRQAEVQLPFSEWLFGEPD